MEEEPFRQLYKIFMKKVGGITDRMEPEAVRRIMDQLFPQLPALVVTLQEAEEGLPLLKTAEIDAAGKASEPDGIFNSEWTIV